MTANTDLDRVREAYPDTEEPSAARLASMRARLVELIDTSATAQPHQRRWRVARRRWRVAAAVGAAAAVAGLIVVSGVLRGGAQNADVAAAATLERYAQTISREVWHPLRPGQWLYFRQLGSSLGHNGPAVTACVEHQRPAGLACAKRGRPDRATPRRGQRRRRPPLPSSAVARSSPSSDDNARERTCA